MIQCEEDQKNIALLQDSLEKVTQKVNIYKRQLTEQVFLPNLLHFFLLQNTQTCLTCNVRNILFEMELMTFYTCDRRACPSSRWRGYDDSSANLRPPKTAPTSLKATWLWSAPSTAPLSPPPPCPALRCIWCRSPARSARSENPIPRPAKHFSPPVDIGAQIPVGYKPSRSLSDVR